MSHNPYAPPTAPVGDEMRLAASLETPTAVVHACRLLWCGVVISILDCALTNILWFERSEVASELLAVLFSLAMTLWFTAKLKRGRNWMRLLMTVLGLLGVVSVPLLWQVMRQVYVTAFGGQPARLTYTVAVTLIQCVLTLVVTLLINTRGARTWFRAMKERRYSAT
jgi:hypothetical protein